jgi:hypothetical protein
LVERVLVELVTSGTTALGPPACVRIVGQLAALRLDHEQTVLGVDHDEVGFALLDATVRAREGPVDGVEDDVLLVELLEEGFVEEPLGGTLRGEHGERDHPRHARMLNEPLRPWILLEKRRG